jgi:hypothetical protein
MKNQLDNPIVFSYNKIVPHVRQAQGEVPAESWIDISGSQQYPFPAKRGTTHERSGEIGGKFNPFQRRDKRALSLFESDITG